jgi:hypothetical protein
MSNQFQPLPPEIICEFFHRFFTLEQSIKQIARETGRLRQTIERYINPARKAQGSMVEKTYRPEPEEWTDEAPKERLIRADQQFCLRMLRAIRRGKEHAPVVPVRAISDSLLPRPIRPPTDGSMTSSAGW